MKKLIAHAAALMTLAAMATDYTWQGDKAYSLEAGDTLTFSENATITSASSFTGSGTVIVSGGTLTLNYKITETPFSGFTGAIRIDSGATVDENSSQGFNEDGTYATSVFGTSAKIVFNGGTLRGFKGQNNSQITGPVEVTADSTLQNDRSNSGSGVNLRFRDSVSFTGSGVLTITSNDRWVEFASGIDFSSFTGGVVLNGNSTQNATLRGTDYGEGTEWTFDANREFVIGPGNWATAKFGALSATRGTIKLGNTFPRLQIGARENSESIINVPFTQNNFELKKVGASSTLALGSAVTFVDDTDITVSAGALVLDGADISSIRTTSFDSSSTQRVTSAGATVKAGTAFAKLEIAAGGKLAIPAPSSAEGAHTLFTYSAKDDGVTFDSSSVEVTGLSLSGNSSANIVDDGIGTVSLVIAAPTLVWGGSGNWGDANAWRDSVDSSKLYTFAPGDNVQIVGGADSASAVMVTLDGDVSVGNLAVSGFVTLGGSGKVSVTGTFSGSDTLTVNAGAELAFANTVTIQKGVLFAGDGTIAFDGATATLDYSLKKTESVPFESFAGTVVLTNNAAVAQTGLSYGYPGDDDNAIYGPFGDTAKIVFAGGTLTGFSQANNIFIHNDIEVVEGTVNTFDPIHANSDSDSPNVNIYGKWTGKGWLNIGFKWFNNASRRFYFKSGCDLTEFEGTLNWTQGGVLQIETAAASGEGTTWIMNTMDRMQFQGLPANSTVKLGKLDYSRNNATGIANYQVNGLALEVGGKNEDSVINSQFNWKEMTLVKKGSGALTLGSGATMYSGSSVTVDAGMLVVNTLAEFSAPITVAAGATLTGSAVMSSVTFAAGAKIAFDSFPGNPEAGATVDGIVVASWRGSKPVIDNVPVSAKGSWKVRTKSVEAGTQFYAEFVKKGLVIIFK